MRLFVEYMRLNILNQSLMILAMMVRELRVMWDCEKVRLRVQGVWDGCFWFGTVQGVWDDDKAGGGVDGHGLGREWVGGVGGKNGERRGFRGRGDRVEEGEEENEERGDVVGVGERDRVGGV
jgi:hypothetical protein